MPTIEQRRMIEEEVGRLTDVLRSLKIEHFQAKRELEKLSAEVINLEFEGSVLEEERVSVKTRSRVDLDRYRAVCGTIGQHQAAMEVRVTARNEARNRVRHLEQSQQKIRGQRQALRTSLDQTAQIVLFPGG